MELAVTAVITGLNVEFKNYTEQSTGGIWSRRRVF
jgi:hypothetical protein